MTPIQEKRFIKKHKNRELLDYPCSNVYIFNLEHELIYLNNLVLARVVLIDDNEIFSDRLYNLGNDIPEGEVLEYY